MESSYRAGGDAMTLPAHDDDPAHVAVRADLLERAALLRSVGATPDLGIAVGLHNAGMPCDEIDNELGLLPGTTRRAVVSGWGVSR